MSLKTKIQKLSMMSVLLLGALGDSSFAFAKSVYHVDPDKIDTISEVAIVDKSPVDESIQDTVIGILRPDQPSPVPFTLTQSYDRVVEMVFAIDTTGSMAGLIDGAKQKVWRIINDVTEQQKKSGEKVLVRVGLVAYRDQGDAYVTQVTPLSSDLDQVYSQLMGFRADGGGDTPEDVRLAMSDALNRTGWINLPELRNQPNRKLPTIGRLSQILFLVGDAPPHDDYKQTTSAQNTAKAALQKGVIVNAIQVGNIRETAPIWREIAQYGGGEYFAIAQSGGVQTVTTPYDEQLAKLGDEMATQGVYYGKDREYVADKASGYAESIASASMVAKADRAKNKAINAEAAYSSSDLVQAIENKTITIDQIKTKDLPDEMQSMSPQEREAFVQKKIEQRNQLRQQISELSKKRDTYLSKHEAGQADAFDTAVSKALIQQIR